MSQQQSQTAPKPQTIMEMLNKTLLNPEFTNHVPADKRKDYDDFSQKVKTQVGDERNIFHADVLLKNMEEMAKILGDSQDLGRKEKEDIQNMQKDLAKWRETVAGADQQQRAQAVVNYGKNKETGGLDKLFEELQNKAGGGSDSHFKTLAGNTATVTSKKGQFGEDLTVVQVKSPKAGSREEKQQKVAEDMAMLLIAKGFKTGTFDKKGNYEKDDKGNDKKGDMITIKGLDTLEQEKEKLEEKHKQALESAQQKGPFTFLAQLVVNAIENSTFDAKKEGLEKQALECYKKGFEVSGMEALGQDFVKKAQETRKEYCKEQKENADAMDEVKPKAAITPASAPSQNQQQQQQPSSSPSMGRSSSS